MHFSLPDEYIEQGNVDLLKEELGLDHKSISKEISKRIKG